MPITGTPDSKIACGARGLPASGTEAGPPERITAFGFISAKRAFGALKRDDLAIDPGLAHPPRDQLRHLAAKIDDEKLVVGGSGGVGGFGHGGPLTRRVQGLRFD